MAYDAEVLVVGCGNVLFKDDGVGPAAIDVLNVLKLFTVSVLVIYFVL